MQTNKDLLTAAYAAFNRREIDAVLALMDLAVDWPNGMDGGRVHGHEQVREYWTRHGRRSILMSSQLGWPTTAAAR